MKKKIRCLCVILLMVLSCTQTNFVAYATEAEEALSTDCTFTLINEQTGEEMQVSPNCISKDVEKNKRTGEIEEEIVAEISIPESGTSNTGIMPRKVVTDIGCTVKLTLNVKYINSGTRYQLTSVSGSFERLDSGFTITNKIVRIVNMMDFDSGVTKSKISGYTFNFANFKKWIDTSKCAVCQIEANAECTISRGGSKPWTLICNNRVVAQGVDLL